MDIRVIIIGAGPIGVGVAREIAARPFLSLVGIVDTDAGKVGRTIEGVLVTEEPPRLVTADGPIVAVVTTTSSLAKLERTALDCISRGWHVVSTCEELAWPWKSGEECDDIAHRLDIAATSQRVSVLGTGVNPGFLMDALPLALTAPCRSVERVCVERVQDASMRRRPFQDKVGVGMAKEFVEPRLRAGLMGHVGLQQSARMIAARLGFAIDSFREEAAVVLADVEVSAAGRLVRVGEVAGVEQVGRALQSGAVKVELFFRAIFGEREPCDRIVIVGEPSLDVSIKGGVPGDSATCAIVANAIAVLVLARPGLRTMSDVPLVACYGQSSSSRPRP